ncbi:MAG: response regulator [Anaerolineales bacterium]|nr:response regulator [Anaerolineales bacterium]
MAHIYVVDDDEQLLRMVGWILERGGHQATLISNPVEAVDRLRDGSPDMAILDVMMPGMSGYDLCRQLRLHPETEHLPVMILTARSQEADKQAAEESGANDFLSKPVTSQELLKHVDNLLGHEEGGTAEIEGNAFIIAVYGLQGGVGRTTLAVNLALSLSAVSNQEVCLVDFSTSGGQTAMHLRLQTQSSWADLLNNHSLDWPAINDLLISHASGLKLLPSPTLPHPPTRPTSDMTQALLALMKQHMQFIVVDLPPVLSASVKGTLASSDMGLHVLTPDVVSVQTAVRADRALSLQTLIPKERSYILNHRNTEVPLPKATIERGLNARIPFEIRYDKNQTRALSQGVPLASSSVQSPLPVSLRVMAEALYQKVSQSE